MAGRGKFEVWVLYTTCLIEVVLGFVPADNYLIDCGSSKNSSVRGRVFLADDSDPDILSAPHKIFAEASASFPNSTDSVLYRTARIFNETSRYAFPIKRQGRHFIRLYFFSFVDGIYNLSTARFSTSVQNSLTLFKDFQPRNVSFVKEYSLNVTSNSLVLSFTPHANSFAFLNALELVSVPDDLILNAAVTIDRPGEINDLQMQSMETMVRVNMGSLEVARENDSLWRSWVSDDKYLKHSNLALPVSNIRAVNYTGKWPNRDTAPPAVYGTATKLRSENDPNLIANVTWLFDVDPGFQYLLRLHFCDIVSTSPGALFFNVYVNSWIVARDLDLSSLTSNILGAPYAKDVVLRLSSSRVLSVSVGASPGNLHRPDAILNGLEIMKINSSNGSLDPADSAGMPLLSRSRTKIGLILGLVFGVILFVAVALGLSVFFVFRRRGKPSQFEHGGYKYPNGSTNFSNSKIGYRFPFAVIREATDNFNDNLVIGAGGFGKVYRGVLRDESLVAVKIGNTQSQQGAVEFCTEVEMLSQFRHRHLVSLIGYCDEFDKMIIVYEYMENGSLKDHLHDHGVKAPCLSWTQRLEICIGSARGLHYLHTGSVKPIIHRDVKSANILLDENLMAKVADFGISRAGPDIDKTHVSTAVKGSFGYLDPEYLFRQQLTEKSDVFSFGVVLLEVLCGRPVIDPSLPQGKVNLIEWAMVRMKKGEVREMVDPRVSGQVKENSLEKFVEMAEKCLADCGLDRPSMGDVLWNLECARRLQESDEASGHGSDGDLPLVDGNNRQVESSTLQFSSASARELFGVSMSKVFSEMLNAER